MLREVVNVKQIEGEPRRRWFVNDYFDLIVWFDEKDTIAGFQLCYSKFNDQHALTWHKDAGYTHSRVDDGENRPGKYKSAPILINDGRFSRRRIAKRFKAASWRLEKRVAELVYERITAYPGSAISRSDS